MPEEAHLFYQFGSALVIGFLIGLQREFAHVRTGEARTEIFAGTRTLSLVALIGASAGYFTLLVDSVIPFALLFGAVVLLVAIAYFNGARTGDAGLTTEMAALMTFIVGALCTMDRVAPAAALGVTTAVLLTLKMHTQRLVQHLSIEDVYATLKFAVITAIVLPILPNTGLGPFPLDVVSPYKVWLMVVFISGISFLGYILIQLVGANRGVGITGILGGLASSTATTLSFSQRSKDARNMAPAFALAILLAWTVMFLRVLVEVAAINPALVSRVLWPMLAAAAVTVSYCGYLMLRPRGRPDAAEQRFTNPFELKPALTFGALYAGILVLANVAQTYLGSAGIYLSSVISGLADVDAMTLSIAQLSASGNVEPGLAADAIVIAAASNTVVKGIFVLSTGSSELRKVILPGIIVAVTASLAVILIN